MRFEDEWLAELGRQVRELRVRERLPQNALAERAGLSVKAVKNLEGGKGATVRSLVRVLRVLNKIDWLRTLAPKVSISPVQLLKSKTPRQRAPRKRRQTPR